jgi:AhpD family alkylhydroperoxidase
MRLNTYTADPGGTKRLAGWSEHLSRGPLSPRIRTLVEARVSQINGCAFCLAMHTEEARAADVPQAMLDSLAAWRDDDAYDDDERAALELSEAMTRLADGGKVNDDVWARVTERFDDATVAALVQVIAMINAYNRINVATRRSAQEFAAWHAAGHV